MSKIDFFSPGYIWPHKYVNVTLYIPIKHMISWINVKIFKRIIFYISYILFQNHLKVLSMWDILLLDIWSTIFTKNPIGTEREKFLKMHQNKAIGMPSRPEVISTPIPKQHSQQTVEVHSGLEKVKVMPKIQV